MPATDATPPARAASGALLSLWAAMAVACLLLLAKKPWALLTPQLWAEDGSIHLVDVDQWGARAFFIPYRGYLHLLPRLIAWIARETADVARWPAIYNGAALLVTLVIFVRLASPRLALPGKPWLVLAFVLVAHSGEIFLNITNLHWLTGFFLVQQVLIGRPQTFVQRMGDIVLTVLAGLSDPSSIIFLPLFWWRWWRDRQGDNLSVLLVVGACAATQTYFLTTAGLHSSADAQPLHLGELLQRVGARLIIWPFFGSWTVTVLPHVALAVIALTAIGALALWALRPHPRRTLRAQVLVAWGLITFSCIYRIRPDTWEVPIENLGFSEPYFYMSRLLLVWLVIWEFDAKHRAVAIMAKVVCVAGALFALPGFVVPEMPNYHWAEQCDPIRRGVPAKIPILPGGWILQYPGRPSRVLSASAAANLRPAYPEVTGEVRFQFPPDGKFPGDPLRTAAPSRTWCSWDDSNHGTGSIAFGPFPAPERLSFAVGGYPREPANHLFIELVATRERIDARPANPGDRWELLDLPLPETWRGQPILLVAIDGATTQNGWLAVGEPLQAGKTSAPKREVPKR